MYGFFNRLLIIDSTRRSHKVQKLEDARLRTYLGGKGLATHYLLGKTSQGIDPLGEENLLIFAIGPLTGTSIWGSCRYGVFTKSPLTGYYAESYSGGTAAEYMAATGFDMFVIGGAAAAPTEKEQMIGPLQAALDAGIKVITVDTFLGDGDYVNGPVKFPISYIGSDNVEGGRISARGLAKAIGGKGTVYVNSTNPNVSSVQGREKGFAEVMAKEYPDIKVLGPDYNLDDQNKAAQQQTAAILEQNPDLAGVFGTNVFSAGGAGTAVVNAGLGGHVQVVAYDATKQAIELLGKGVVSLVLAQKPFDMGYMAVEFAAADAAGVTSLPRRVETGFAIIDKDNVSDPAYSRFIYAGPRIG